MQVGGLDIERLVSSCCERETYCMRVSERSMTITMDGQDMSVRLGAPPEGCAFDRINLQS